MATWELNITNNLEEYKVLEDFEEGVGLFDDGKKLYRFKFPNGYGASIIKGCGTFGYDQDMWELAVLEYQGDRGHLCYDTDITDDVIGYLSDEDVCCLLEKIKSL